MADENEEFDVPISHTGLPDEASNTNSDPTKETESSPRTTDPNVFRERLNILVEDIIALSPPDKSPLDDKTWTHYQHLEFDYPDGGNFSRLLLMAWNDAFPQQDDTIFNASKFRVVEWDTDYQGWFEPWGRYWRWECVEWLRERFDGVAALKERMKEVVSDAVARQGYEGRDVYVPNERVKVFMALAEVGIDAVGYVILACRRLVTLETQAWRDTTVYPEKEFVLRVYDLVLDVVLALEWMGGYEVDFEKKTSLRPVKEAGDNEGDTENDLRGW